MEVSDTSRESCFSMFRGVLTSRAQTNWVWLVTEREAFILLIRWSQGAHAALQAYRKRWRSRKTSKSTGCRSHSRPLVRRPGVPSFSSSLRCLLYFITGGFGLFLVLSRSTGFVERPAYSLVLACSLATGTLLRPAGVHR